MSIWEYRKISSGKAPPEWAESLSVTPLFLNILWRRGLTDFQMIDDYLSARLNKLTNPSLWPQIPEAASILSRELLAGKKIAIWGDYDVDGITATTLVLDVLEAHGFAPAHYLPDRRKEGYGLNIPALEALAADGCELLLTVDCGISDVEPIRRANELGMSVIVSDHHLPPEILPPARAVVNPRMPEAGNWPCRHLAGVGVAFYLMAALNNILSAHSGRKYKMDKALDLVALGTLADVMRLEGENRILVRAGLASMTKTERLGMAALKAVSGFDLAAQLTAGQAVFRLAPRINAAGRMGHADLALNLLRSRDYSQARELARKLDECNTNRKCEEDRIHAEARAQAEELLAGQNYAGLTLFDPDWHPGIVGIVASRIVEEFNRPAIILCEDNGSMKGSGRSVHDFDLHAGLAKIADCLMAFGGHRQAAGLRLKREKLDEFRKAFANVAREVLGDKPHEPVLLLEGELDFAQASNQQFLRELQLMQPFGPGNAEPVFSSPPLLVCKRSPLGHGHEHVLLHVRDSKSGVTLPAKAWRMAEQFPPSVAGKTIRLAYTPRLDIYNGMPGIDIGIKDWRLES